MSSLLNQPAPEFEREAHTGEMFRLADYRGRSVVVLYFYPRDGTTVCTRQACSFRDAYEQFSAAGAAVIGVSGDSLERHRAFAERQRLPFPLVSDADGALRRAYEASAAFGLLPGRVTYVIDKAGVVRHVFRGLFTADRHVAEALEVVRRLVAEKGGGGADGA